MPRFLDPRVPESRGPGPAFSGGAGWRSYRSVTGSLRDPDREAERAAGVANRAAAAGLLRPGDEARLVTIGLRERLGRAAGRRERARDLEDQPVGVVHPGGLPARRVHG